MQISLGKSLKSKILIGFLCMASLSICAAVFGVYNLYRLEDQLKQVNLQFVPLLKVLEQIDSHLYFFDRDIEDAIQANRSELEIFHVQIMESKLDALQRIFTRSRADSNHLKAQVDILHNNFFKFIQATKKIFKYPKEEDVKKIFSISRNEFKHQLKNMKQEIELNARKMSIEIQSQISNAVIIMAMLVVFFSLFSAGLVLWIDRILKPLQELTKIVVTISEQGLNPNHSIELQKNSTGQDEISMFSRQFGRMASSLFERSRELEKQKNFLEKAHQVMVSKNEELQRTQEKLAHQEKLSIVGKLSAQMAHEIRNPLNALGLHLDQMEYELAQSSDLGSVETITCMKNEITRLAELTENYLLMARSPYLEYTKVNINDLILEQHKLYKFALKEYSINVHCNLSIEAPVLRLDKKNISLVLGNLLKNSLEALKDQKNWYTIEKIISIQTKFNKSKNSVEIVFSDNGLGVKSEHLNNIFSPFFTTKANGTGLGLSHSKQIIDAHGGEIYLRSIEAKGTSVFICLPVEGSIANA